MPGASIYYHTHRFLQQHHYLSPEPPNDFAFWITTSLGLDELGEKLASVNTVRYGKIEELRAKYIEILKSYLEKENFPDLDCHEGEEFHFMSCKTFILPTTYVAHDLKEFLEIFKRISIHSLYFHIFEARLRLERGENDFSLWFESLGKKKLATEISKLDPYTITLDGLKNKIIQLVGKHVQD